MKHAESLESTKDASFLIVKKNRGEIFFFSRDLFADVMSVHNRNMKHAHAVEFD